MNTSILVSVTNGLIGLRNATAGDYWQAFNIACITLTKLADDRVFFDQLDSTARGQAANAAAIQATLDNVEQFNEFVLADKKVLRDAGLRPPVVETLLSEAHQLRAHLGNWKIEPERVRVAITKVRNEVCNAKDDLDERASAAERRSLLIKVARMVGGATIIAANVAATPFLGQAWSEISIRFGFLLVKPE